MYIPHRTKAIQKTVFLVLERLCNGKSDDAKHTHIAVSRYRLGFGWVGELVRGSEQTLEQSKWEIIGHTAVLVVFTLGNEAVTQYTTTQNHSFESAHVNSHLHIQPLI
jgi:hypothetical protein